MADDDDLTFADLGLRPELLAALDALGYEEPTPIQRAAVPALLSGRDAVAQAATGTGKTAAFALPILERLERGNRGPAPTALVLVPTRELCGQVSEAVHRYGRELEVRCLPVYGGAPIVRQLRELKRGVDVVIATPGRAVDLISRGALRLDAVRTVVLDEADEMLDMGFADDLEAVLSATPAERQTVLFSATMPARIAAIARKHLRDPQRIEVEREEPAQGSSPAVRQTAYVVARASKAAALGRVLDIESPTATIVFCRTREEVSGLTESLNGRGYRAAALHGGIDQSARERVISRLRSGQLDLVVATDVAARGLDVDTLTHVVNYDLPSATESYIHRIGRVGRAGRTGVAITLCEPREHRMLKAIEKATGAPIRVEKLPTVADVLSRRLELTRLSLLEAIEGEDLETYRVIVDSLSDEHDVVEIAMAAIKLAHEAAGGPVTEEEIPEPEVPAERARGKDGKPAKGAKPGKDGKAGKPVKEGKPGSGKRSSEGPTTRVQINMGRDAGIRPQDLVGAIAGETGLRGKDVGGIEIADRFCIVEVPSGSARDVVDALQNTRLRGRKPKARILHERP